MRRDGKAAARSSRPSGSWAAMLISCLSCRPCGSGSLKRYYFTTDLDTRLLHLQSVRLDPESRYRVAFRFAIASGAAKRHSVLSRQLSNVRVFLRIGFAGISRADRIDIVSLSSWAGFMNLRATSVPELRSRSDAKPSISLDATKAAPRHIAKRQAGHIKKRIEVFIHHAISLNSGMRPAARA